MKIGILSDTHNHAHNTTVVLNALRERGVARVIHCGDITTPAIVFLFAGWQVTFVLGNMDHARSDLADAARSIGAAPPAASRVVEVDGKLIGVTHGHDYALLHSMIMSGKYSYICHGHTHHRLDEFRSPYSVRLINPGAVGGNHPQSRSVCVLDASADTIEFIEFPALD